MSEVGSVARERGKHLPGQPMLMPEYGRLEQETKAKVPTGKLRMQLRDLDEKNRQRTVNIYYPPREGDPHGYGYIVTDNKTGEEVMWDLNTRVLLEPQINAIKGGKGNWRQGGLNPKTQEELEKRNLGRK